MMQCWSIRNADNKWKNTGTGWIGGGYIAESIFKFVGQPLKGVALDTTLIKRKKMGQNNKLKNSELSQMAQR